MAKIDEDAIAKLKALFQDNEKALGSNFSQLIDFFNNNKVTDNGDGTFTVGTITVDASKLYDLINNSSPNILPLDNEFTGKNTFDIAPINKANGKPYITVDSVPQPDLSNYPTKDQLATKADTSAIDPSVMVKRILTADDDVLALDPGTYWVWGIIPKNYPALKPWSTVVVKILNGKPTDGKSITITDTSASQLFSIYLGSALTSKWSDWQVPNAVKMASKYDVTTAVNAATANMVDSSKPTNFTAGLKSGGVDVATAADIKSVEASAWHLMTLPDVPAATGMHMLYKVYKPNNLLYIVLDGTYKSATSSDANGLLLADLSSIVKGISGVNVIAVNTTSNFHYYDVNFAQSPHTGSVSFGYSGTKLILKSPYANAYAPMIETSSADLCIKYGSTIKYTDLV